MKIGDIIYFKYEGNVLFRKVEILAETSRSWVCAPPSTYDWIKDAARRNDPRAVKHYEVTKLPKNGNGYTVGTTLEATTASWAMTYKHAVSRRVEYAMTPEQILQVAKAIGFTPLPEDINVTTS